MYMYGLRAKLIATVKRLLMRCTAPILCKKCSRKANCSPREWQDSSSHHLDCHNHTKHLGRAGKNLLMSWQHIKKMYTIISNTTVVMYTLPWSTRKECSLSASTWFSMHASLVQAYTASSIQMRKACHTKTFQGWKQEHLGTCSFDKTLFRLIDELLH